MFVHCPLQILVERLTQRNFRAYSSGDLPNLRRVSDVMYEFGQMDIHTHASGNSRDSRKISDLMHAFGKMYVKSYQDCQLGTFSDQDF